MAKKTPREALYDLQSQIETLQQTEETVKETLLRLRREAEYHASQLAAGVAASLLLGPKILDLCEHTEEILARGEDLRARAAKAEEDAEGTDNV